MYMKFKDSTKISFGKLSTPGVVKNSPLSDENINIEHFNDQNFQYIVDNIADMFGLAHGSINASVVEKDYEAGWYDLNNNDKVDDGEISFNFTMNAGINTYDRESYYGKHFMYLYAAQYGYPITYGIVAHEVGHLVNRYTMNVVENQIVDGIPCLVEVQSLKDYWDELCADYLAGVVLAQASPRLSHEPMKNFLIGTQADSAHPDGFWRVYAVEMGYRWGSNNSPMLVSRIFNNRANLNQLLVSFFKNYYQQVYGGVDAVTRSRYSPIPQYMAEKCFNIL